MLTPFDERGSAAVESVVSIVVLIVMVLGVIQVAFSLYARNVVAASAHEGARAAVERGRSVADAEAVAVDTVRQSAGALVAGLDVDVGVRTLDDRSIVSVRVSGRVKPFGPVPIPIELQSDATAVSEADIP